MDLRVVHVSQRLHKDIPIPTMGGNVMAKAGSDRMFVAFHLSVSLWVVFSRCRALCTKMSMQDAKEFAEN